jgi:hypothetical protein
VGYVGTFTLTAPDEPVAEIPVGETFALATVVTAPGEAAPELPVTGTFALATTVAVLT